MACKRLLYSLPLYSPSAGFSAKKITEYDKTNTGLQMIGM